MDSFHQLQSASAAGGKLIGLSFLSSDRLKGSSICSTLELTEEEDNKGPTVFGRFRQQEVPTT
jgi:hypothetical protein